MEPDFVLRPEWLDASKRHPVPDWEKIWKWMESEFTDDRHAGIWNQLACDWVNRIASVFPVKMQIGQSANFIVTIPTSSYRIELCLQQLEEFRGRILESLVGIELYPWVSRSVVIITPDMDAFTAYLADYYDDGNFMMPGGIYLNRGYGHFILPDGDLTHHSGILAHELCHACLAGNTWPLWLEEGVVQTIEHKVAGTAPYILNREILERHRRYWSPDLMQLFWSGKAFGLPDEGSELSYHLGRFLLNAVIQNGRDSMLSFLRKADYADAGFAAMASVLGVTPAEILCDMLGDKDWNLVEKIGPKFGV